MEHYARSFDNYVVFVRYYRLGWG